MKLILPERQGVRKQIPASHAYAKSSERLRREKRSLPPAVCSLLRALPLPRLQGPCAGGTRGFCSPRQARREAQRQRAGFAKKAAVVSISAQTPDPLKEALAGNVGRKVVFLPSGAISCQNAGAAECSPEKLLLR